MLKMKWNEKKKIRRRDESYNLYSRKGMIKNGIDRN